ncbi:MAG: T9SS C-terminal target domain-containing protein [Haliscomenobacteraceae bacterium CHB4]|nr:T9SS C-terminal target domain-containing protein [Haliscomenobacteraceae bacterium CHB4]
MYSTFTLQINPYTSKKYPMLQKLIFTGAIIATCILSAFAQTSVARRWNEVLLQSIREDFARPPVHARNLFHVSLALYDAWAAYDTVAETYLLGKTVGAYTCPFEGIPVPADIQAAREEAMSYAAYRVLKTRFVFSPNAGTTLARFNNLMATLGYDPNFVSTDYSGGSPAALGNYLGQCIVQMGLQDGANEQNNYAIQYYETVNPPLVMANPGNPTLLDPNRWQRLTLTVAIDQNGNPIPGTQVFQSPEWGNVQPFALTTNDLTVYQRDGNDYRVYHDPGPFPTLDTANGGLLSDEYKWNFALVTAWGAHHDPNDGVLWDISPRSIGNVQSFPQTLADYHTFYDFVNGGDTGIGRDTNPRTGQPYVPQIVPRGDYTRVLAQYWADGPNSETPPGHWFAILNYVSDHPDFIRKYNGKGPELDQMEWDVKAYFTLGGAVHDAAISAWGIKGWYDGVRPVSALRYMADLGQCSDSTLGSYNPDGIPLVPGFIELVQAGDPLAGPADQNVGKIKFYTWRGPDYVTNPATQIAGVGWILAENWWPYQRKTFVTPPFAGYISGHSTYSRAAAETLTLLTGDEYFPGGMGEFYIPANSGFLGLEKGPSVDVRLQWATYRDASDQTSLSRIWGGIHPPMDDIPGRLIGAEVGTDAFHLAETYFYKDADNDGIYSYEDCDDANPDVYPGAPERCDNLDNGLADDMPFFTYYADQDGDGYGAGALPLDTCLTEAPAGFAANDLDCDDDDAAINPDAQEIVDSLDNDCNGFVDDVVGTTDLFLNNIRVYPNPVRDRLLIHHPENAVLGLKILDISGKTLRNATLNFGAEAQPLDFSPYPAGMYFLNIRDVNTGREMFVKVVKTDD